jgi:hypothetical protein
MSRHPYAAQWWLFFAAMILLSGAAVASVDPSKLIVAVTVQACIVAGSFIAGFCYRQRLHQLGREPKLRAFRRMLQ